MTNEIDQFKFINIGVFINLLNKYLIEIKMKMKTFFLFYLRKQKITKINNCFHYSNSTLK
jgi:hypothetical protein